MGSESLASVDWSAAALLVLIAAALVWSFVLVLRQNRKDLDDLEETIEADRKDDEK